MPTRKTSPATKSAKTKKKSTASRAASKTKAKQASSASRKKAPAKRKKKKKAASAAGSEEVTIDRRRGDRRDKHPATETSPKLERRKKVARRRQIDPTTCERDYSEQEVEFMNALDDYKRKNGRMFPTCSEVLEVIRSLGYVQLSPAEQATRTTIEEDTDEDQVASVRETEYEPQLV